MPDLLIDNIGDDIRWPLSINSAHVVFFRSVISRRWHCLAGINLRHHGSGCVVKKDCEKYSQEFSCGLFCRSGYGKVAICTNLRLCLDKKLRTHREAARHSMSVEMLLSTQNQGVCKFLLAI